MNDDERARLLRAGGMCLWAAFWLVYFGLVWLGIKYGK